MVRFSMKKPTFNNGKPYSGSEIVQGGRLRGMTDATEQFYFLCPHCKDNSILQVLDFLVERDGPVKYAPEDRPGAKRDFKIVFQIRCHKCGMSDFVEISNDAWQGGKITDGLSAIDSPPLYPK